MIRRRAPLKRTPLASPTRDQLAAWQRKPRKPVNRLGRKARREQSAWVLCRTIVLTRSGGLCEANLTGVCPRWKHGATAVHHVWPEDRDKGLHDPSRCLHLCDLSHRWAHENPAKAKEAGLLRPVPVRVVADPIWPE